MAFKFEELKVWQKSLDLSLHIHNIAKSFPDDERYILASQIKRGADSVSLNIAEGSTGQTNKEFNRFLSISLRSAIEVVACLHIGIKRELILKEDFDQLYDELTEIIKMIQGLKKSLRVSE